MCTGWFALREPPPKQKEVYKSKLVKKSIPQSNHTKITLEK